MLSEIIYKLLHFFWSSQVVRQFVFALFASTIFYFIVVYFPRKKENKIAKEFVVETYKRARISIIENLLSILNKKKHIDLKENYLNYIVIRDMISDNDMQNLINYYDSEKFRNLNIEILHEFDTLKNTLNYTLSYDFVRHNHSAYNRFHYLIQWIDQFHHDFNTLFRTDDDHEYSKSFRNYIDEHIRGVSIIHGESQLDDFIKIVEDSYKSSLLLHKIRVLAGFFRKYTLSTNKVR